MALTKAQEKQVISHINKAWSRPECQLCGVNEWATIGVISLPISESSGISFSPQHLPTVAAVCTNCGNTVLLNLKIIEGRETK